MSNQVSTSNEKQKTVQDIIREIEQKSEGGGYIYRGERELHNDPPHNGKVSSNLWREYGIEDERFDIELVQKEMIAAAKKHTGDLPQNFQLDVIAASSQVGEPTQEAIDFEILTEIQHYGGRTNLIDFTTDYFIALFFACDGSYDKDGRVILQKIDEVRNIIANPRNPRHRIIAQKSLFIKPARGFIEPSQDQIVIIPSHLKQSMHEHLRNYHAIFTETIYNDLYGFIRNQDIHGDAHTHFYKGFVRQNNGDKANTPQEKKEEYEKALQHYTRAIQLKQDYAKAYNNRGNVYLSKDDYDLAIRDHTQAIALRPEYPEAYNNRGVVYLEKCDYDQANRDHTQAIALRPEYPEAYNNRGIAHVAVGEYDNAIRDYSQAIQLKQDYVDAYRNRSEAWMRLKEWEKAKADLTIAKNLGMDIAAEFHTTFGDIANFERIYGVQFPEDIVTLLTPPQA